MTGLDVGSPASTAVHMRRQVSESMARLEAVQGCLVTWHLLVKNRMQDGFLSETIDIIGALRRSHISDRSCTDLAVALIVHLREEMLLMRRHLYCRPRGAILSRHLLGDCVLFPQVMIISSTAVSSI